MALYAFDGTWNKEKDAGEHVLALDERRQAFHPTRTQGGYEVWFRGVHSDIGGGNDNLALNNISLRWMLKKGLAAGLPIKQETLTALDAAIDPDTKIGRNFDPIRNRPREVLLDDRIHYTVSRRPGNEHNNPPDKALASEQGPSAWGLVGSPRGGKTTLFNGEPQKSCLCNLPELNKDKK